jgi:hypothetical protein
MLAYYGPEWESLQSRMVGRWCPSFSGNTGLQLPDTMGRNHGVLRNFSNNGNHAYVASPDRLSLTFDGSNDHVLIPQSGVGLAQFSLFFWARPLGSVSTQQGMFQWANTINSNVPFVLITRQSGSVTRFYANGDYRQTVTTPSDWANYGFAYSAGVWNFFLNGFQVGSHTGGLANQANATNLYFGSGFQVYFQGQIDDVLLMDAAPTASEIGFIYEQGRGGGLLLQPPRRRSVAAVIAALVLACETGNYSLTGQAAGLFASRLLAADQAQYLLSGNAANITASRLLSADPALYTATGNDAATICARLLDGGAAAYALTGTDAGLIANRKLTAEQAICFLAGNNAELLRSLKLNAGSMAMQIDNFAASLLADRKISADGAQYILVVSDANLTGSASGVAPYYYLFMMRGPQ